MTIEAAKNTFLFDFIKSEMILRNTTELTKEVLNAAYQKTVKFLADENNLHNIKNNVKHLIKK